MAIRKMAGSSSRMTEVTITWWRARFHDRTSRCWQGRAQVNKGNPICKVRIAGTVETPTAWLSNNGAASLAAVAAPYNLNNLPLDAGVTLGYCDDMQAPSESTLRVYGSQSGAAQARRSLRGQLDRRQWHRRAQSARTKHDRPEAVFSGRDGELRDHCGQPQCRRCGCHAVRGQLSGSRARRWAAAGRSVRRPCLIVETCRTASSWRLVT